MRHRSECFTRSGKLVVALNISDGIFGEHLISLEHFRNRPAECTGRLSRVGNHGNKQMRNTVINRKFNLLRVNHQKLDLVGI